MHKAQNKNIRLKRRKARVRSKFFGTATTPRLSVFRSHKHFYAQLIDDENSKTIVSASTVKIASKSKNKTAQAEELAKLLHESLKKKGIEKAVFDRGPYQYHGRVKALAESLRKLGFKI